MSALDPKPIDFKPIDFKPRSPDMLRATSLIRKPAVKPAQAADELVLDHTQRRERRATLTTAGGLALLLDLDKATVLNDGDALKLEDGRQVVIRAAAERLLCVTAENPLRLARAAWHLGSRHAPAEIAADAIYIAPDPALAELLRGQGCTVAEVERPFQPERDAGHAHHHGHDHDHGHHHHHDHGHGHHGHAHHAHDHHAHDHHEHGPDCGCGHDHAHDHERHSLDRLDPGAEHGHAHGHGPGHAHKHEH